MNATVPTSKSYGSLQQAYDFFNARLFGGTLPNCLITLTRKQGAGGYWAGERFVGLGEEQKWDEIALNPVHFQRYGSTGVLGILVHEMVHLWQAHFGKLPRRAYHDKQWGAKMEEIGLVPSDTEKPGGKKTGQKMSHYVQPGGPFEKAAEEFEASHQVGLYQDAWALPVGTLSGPGGDSPAEKAKKARAKSKQSKTKFTCPGCSQNAWAKPTAKLMCGECEEHMEPADGGGEDE